MTSFPQPAMPTRRPAAPDGVVARVMICDDSVVIRGALARMLEGQPQIQVVARVANGALAVAEVQRQLRLGTPIDVVVLDIEMPVMDGMQALPMLLRSDPKLRVVMASTRARSLASSSRLMRACSSSQASRRPSSVRASLRRSSCSAVWRSTATVAGRLGRVQVSQAFWARRSCSSRKDAVEPFTQDAAPLVRSYERISRTAQESASMGLWSCRIDPPTHICPANQKSS